VGCRLICFVGTGCGTGGRRTKASSARHVLFIVVVLANVGSTELNPTEPVELDEADAELLFDPPTHAQVPAANGHAVGSVPSTPGVNVQPNVSWLRRAEYASRSMSRQGTGTEM
jgi:hypothetical protein